MYKRIVEKKVRAIFEKINGGDYMAMIDSLAEPFVYRFHGEHALGGTRTTTSAMVRWWERVMRLLPQVQFDVRDVLVAGYPWRTRVAVHALVSGDIPGGARYENTVFQFFTLAWGKVTSVETLEDVQVLERALRAVADAGEPEALAAPLED